jgi:hypothetical protein
MGDCLRVYDKSYSEDPYHIVAIFYDQIDSSTKKLKYIVEVNLTNAGPIMFGSLTRSQIETLNNLVKKVPANRSPTLEEYNAMYDNRNLIQQQSGAIHLDIKCNSQQSRLQCSFNSFEAFLTKIRSDAPERIIAESRTNNFRGGQICETVQSGRRTFNN